VLTDRIVSRRQKSRRVDFSHLGRAAGLTSAQRKLQCSSSFSRPAPQHREWQVLKKNRLAAVVYQNVTMRPS
jgi:hypothetical protein